METLAQIKKPATTEALPSLMDFVKEQIGMMQFSDEKKADICLAVEEALKNILYYGRCLENTEIDITFKLDNFGRFLIIITDSGAPFNMLLSDVLPGEEKTADVSTKIIKRVIKDLEYKRFENKNILTFTIPNL